MSFETPLMLLGLVALALPLWLHLRRQRELLTPFPATTLLQTVVKKRHRRLRLRNLVLLLVRMLVIASFVIAAARPGLSVVRPGGIRTGPPLILAVVLDDSLSMNLTDQLGETLFDKARKLALDELERLRPGDGAIVVLSGEPVPTPEADDRPNTDRAKDAVRQALPSYRRGNLAGGLHTAKQALASSSFWRREIVVITDFSENTTAPGTMSRLAKGDTKIRFINAGPHTTRHNISIPKIAIDKLTESSPREIEVEAEIANWSDAQRTIEVILEIDGQEATRGTTVVPAFGSATKKFHHLFRKDGLHLGAISIPGDRLPEDDRRHFAVTIHDAVRVLVINGDHHPGSFKDEVFYLLRALSTPLTGRTPIRATAVSIEDARSVQISEYDAIFVAGVTEIDRELAGRLTTFVKRGGGLFVSAASSETKLDSLVDILPGRFRSVRRNRQNGRPFPISAIDKNHPLFAPFEHGPTGLEEAKIAAHMLIEPDPATAKSVLIELRGGLPLLLERAVGEGTVMVLTTTIDRAWSDLPIRPGYLPLVQRAARLLAGQLDSREHRVVTTGEAVPVDVPRGTHRLAVHGPEQLAATYSGADLEGRSAVNFSQTWVPGHYRSKADIPEYGGIKELSGQTFVVVTAPEESDPSVKLVAAKSEPEENWTPIKGNLPLWPTLLLGAVLLMLLEGLVAGLNLRRSHRQKPR